MKHYCKTYCLYRVSGDRGRVFDQVAMQDYLGTEVVRSQTYQEGVFFSNFWTEILSY